MKINELLVESKAEQLDELDIGQAGKAVAKGAGKVIGGVAKGVGALAGIPGGVKKAFQQGKQAATDVIGGTGQGADSAEPTVGQGTAAPAGSGAAAEPAPQGFIGGLKKGLGMKQGGGAAPAQPAAGATPPTAQDINATGPKGTAPAKAQTGAAGAALAKTAQATQGANAEKVGQTVYAQVKSQINQLDKKGKQRILQLLQKSMAAPAPAAGAQPATAPAAQPAAPAAKTPKTKKPAAAGPDGRVEPTMEPAAAPAAAEPTAKKKKGGRQAKPAAPSQAEIDADRNRLMGNFTDSIERHKQKMFAESISKGQASIFRK